MYISLYGDVNTFIGGRQPQNKLMRLRTKKKPPQGLTEHILVAAMYATAAASGLWEDRPPPPLAQAAQDAPSLGPTAEDIHQVLHMPAAPKTHAVIRSIQLVGWDAMDTPPATTEVHILKHRDIWWTV